MEARDFILCSTRGVPQIMTFSLLPVEGGFAVRSKLRIDGCHPRMGPCVLTPIPHETAIKWINSRTYKLTKSAAAFRPVLSFEQQIEALFFGS